MADWQVYLMMTAIVVAMLLGKKLMFFDSNKKNSGSMGILICGSGIGMSMAANKFDGIRAALCHNEYSARMARKHNDANVLCLGERVSGEGMIEAIIKAWDKAEFEEGRHTQRVEKINALSKIGNCRA